ncbi:MAG: HD domain-containing protein [Polyangia bacterium]
MMDEIVQIPEPSRRILFVDDDKLVSRAFAREVERNTDYVVTVSSSGEEALKEVDERPHAIVFSDYKMPGMDGIELLEKVRSRAPDTIRILVSGKADFQTAVEVINRVGLFNFVLKPWDPTELKTTVERAMKHYQLIYENRYLTAQLADKVGQLGRLTTSLEEEVQRRTTSLLLGLINSLDLRDTETQTHSWRVSLYSRRIAEEMKIEGDELLEIERGALLHDIGKIGVSDTILLKPGKLTDEEWEAMRRHAEYGYRILEGIDFLGNARRLVYEHHERWDGTGYPRKLKGEEIYLGARIFAVVDTYDAMTTDRPYRKALPHEVADEEIAKMRGSQFDPEVVDVWRRIPRLDLEKLRIEAKRGRSIAPL